MKWKDFNLDRKDSKFLIIIAIFTLVTILFRINTHMDGGIYSPDVGLYLLNSLSFAQMDYYVVDATNLYFAPLICMLTAILFKVGINFKAFYFNCHWNLLFCRTFRFIYSAQT